MYARADCSGVDICVYIVYVSHNTIIQKLKLWEASLARPQALSQLYTTMRGPRDNEAMEVSHTWLCRACWSYTVAVNAMYTYSDCSWQWQHCIISVCWGADCMTPWLYCWGKIHIWRDFLWGPSLGRRVWHTRLGQAMAEVGATQVLSTSHFWWVASTQKLHSTTLNSCNSFFILVLKLFFDGS